jgi:hypothetical protein
MILYIIDFSETVKSSSCRKMNFNNITHSLLRGTSEALHQDLIIVLGS